MLHVGLALTRDEDEATPAEVADAAELDVALAVGSIGVWRLAAAVHVDPPPSSSELQRLNKSISSSGVTLVVEGKAVAD